jgi:2-polyprenyl-3-methyl-5-hydroxy-6-metoxy-1,4-benzoquinol methylase
VTSVAEYSDSLARNGRSPAYMRKQMHACPQADVVDRVEFIVKRCIGKRVLDIGASGHLHEAIALVAKEHWGVDHPSNNDGRSRPGVFYIDLDQRPEVPNRNIDIIVCGEVIEHLSNPGRLLAAIHAEYPGVPLIVTVPNAFSEIARSHMKHGTINVHFDHVAWYCPQTLKTLLGRAGYRIAEMHWYNGQPRFAEGIIAVAETE